MQSNNLNPRHVLAIVLVSYLMIVLDISIVITALPDIQQSMQLSAAALSWVQNIYTLCFGGFLLLSARVGDLLGRKKTLMAGLALFTAASLMIGFSHDYLTLVCARAVQGIGAAILAPSTLALLTQHFPQGPERNKALSLYAAAAGIGSSLGLVIGGLLTGWLDWRIGFFINVPVGVALFVASMRLLRETPVISGKFDVPGALLSTAGMSALVFSVIESSVLGWGAMLPQVSFLSAVVLLTLFVRHEYSYHQPIMPLRLFSHKVRVGAYLSRMLFLGAMVGFFFFSTQFLQRVIGFTPAQTGMAFLPVTIPTFLASLLVPYLTRKFGIQKSILLALSFSIAGMLCLTQLSAQSHYWSDIALPMILIGIGNGTVLGPLTLAGMTDITAEDSGAASGVVNVAHQLGGSLGLSILIALFSSAASEQANYQAMLAQQLDTAFAGASAFLLAALLIAAYFMRKGSLVKS